MKRLALASFALVAGCSRSSAPLQDPLPSSATSAAASAHPTPATPPSASPLARGTPCAARADAGASIGCARFASAEDAFRAVVESTSPLVLAIGEAHAQKGTEAIASATKRFGASLLPIVAPRASDVVAELWIPPSGCQQEVKQVASAQKPVTTAQAATNVNEYDVLGSQAKALGVTPWPLRPTCADMKTVNDAGEDKIAVMLGLVKSLTTSRVRTLLARNAAAEAGAPRTVLVYGGMMHNDLAPTAAGKDYTFGPDLLAATGGRYVELDLVVPEYIKPSPTWQALPWYATHEAGSAEDPARATLYQVGERSFVLVFPKSS